MNDELARDLDIAEQNSSYPVSPEMQEDIDAYLEQESRKIAAAVKREKRLKDCGSWGYHFDPHTGKPSGHFFYCDLFRECPTCKRRRAEKEQKWMLEAYHKADLDFLFIVADNQEEGNRLLRGIGKKEYVRYPQQDGSDIIFLDGSLKDEFDGKEVTADFLRELQWEEIVITPEGRNKSGSMHTPSSPADPEPFAIIETKQFISNAPSEIIDSIMFEAIWQTFDLDPHDAKEVEAAITRRSEIAISLLEARGYTVNVYDKKLKITLSKIDWVKFSVNDLMVKTKNLTSKPPD